MRAAIFIAILSCLLGIQAVAQQKSAIPFVALEQQLRMQRLNLRLSLAPTAGCKLGKFRIGTGPLFLLKEFPEAGRVLPRLNGWQLGTQYQLKRREEQLIQPFFGFRSSLEQLSETWVANDWDSRARVYQEYELKSVEELWDHSLYGGASIQLPAALQLQLSLSVGYFHSYLRSQASSQNSQFPIPDYRPYQEKGVSVGCSVGLSYSWHQLLIK